MISSKMFTGDVSQRPEFTLRVLLWLRWMAIAGQISLSSFVHYELDMPMPMTFLLWAAAALAIWNALTFMRLRRAWPATHWEVLVHLAFDITVFTLTLYWTGGATNPFVSLYLVPIAIAATAMPVAFACAAALLCAAAYSLLMIAHIPLPMAHDRYGGDFNLHVIGMWINFLISAGLVTVFVTCLAQALKSREQRLAATREQLLRNEHITALGTFAAGAAHELSTPLSTMAVLIDDLAEDADSADAQTVATLKQQIGVCKEKVSELMESVGQTRLASGHPSQLRQFVDGVVERWRLMRPEFVADVQYSSNFEDRQILVEPTLPQSVTSLLNNAADASAAAGHDQIAVTAVSAKDRLTLHIDDFGEGVAEEVAGRLGREFVTTKETGSGAGLMTASASVGRFGGEVRLTPRSEGGSRTTVRLPLEKLLIGD